MSVQKTGDWDVALRILRGSSTRLKAAVGKAIRQEAHLLRSEIVQGLTKQAPGGEPLAQPSPLTLAARELKGRGGSKALLVKGDLRNSVTVIVKGDEAFVGVSRKARTDSGEALVDVAEVQEFGKGPIIVPMTPAMRRFLFALLRKAEQEPRGGSGRGVVVINIPARPFLRPAFKKFSRGAQARFLARVAKLGGMGGR